MVVDEVLRTEKRSERAYKCTRKQGGKAAGIVVAVAVAASGGALRRTLGRSEVGRGLRCADTNLVRVVPGFDANVEQIPD